MNLLLKNKTIHIMQNRLIPLKTMKLNAIIADTETPQWDSIKISFDGTTYVDFVKGMTIPEPYHNLKSMKLSMKYYNKKRQVMRYDADELVVKHMIVIGEDTDLLFPKEFQSVKEQANKNSQDIIALAKIIKRIQETGEL